MPAIIIDHRLCDLCGECIDVCGMQALVIEQGRLKMLEPSLCMVCKQCEDWCHAGAIHVYGEEDTVPVLQEKFVWCYRT